MAKVTNTEKNLSVEDQLQVANKNLADKSDEFDKLKSDHDALQEKHDALSKEHSELQEGSKNEIEGLQQKVEDLEGKLQVANEKPEETVAATSAESLHTQRLKKYGQGYLVCKRGSHQTVFSAIAWKNLGKDKAGWEIIVNEPPEVKALKKQI